MFHKRNTYKVDDLVLVESVFSEKSQESLKSLYIYKRQVRETFHDFSHLIWLDLMINVKKFAYDLVEGLSYLHENGIIFADLKPSNILFNEFS